MRPASDPSARDPAGSPPLGQRPDPHEPKPDSPRPDPQSAGVGLADLVHLDQALHPPVHLISILTVLLLLKSSFDRTCLLQRVSQRLTILLRHGGLLPTNKIEKSAGSAKVPGAVSLAFITSNGDQMRSGGLLALTGQAVGGSGG